MTNRRVGHAGKAILEGPRNVEVSPNENSNKNNSSDPGPAHRGMLVQVRRIHMALEHGDEYRRCRMCSQLTVYEENGEPICRPCYKNKDNTSDKEGTPV